MISKEDLLKHPNYLLTRYQIEIFRQLEEYRIANNLTQKDLAQKLGVSSAYVNQVLRGKFNFTLKKLIQLGIAIGKIPSIEFLTVDDYWSKQETKKQNVIIAQIPNESQVIIKMKTFSIGSQVSSEGTFSNEDVEYDDDVWINQSLN